ncbi:MAG: DUF4383 domain-containing protein [Actinomycetota bacterium]
MSVTLERRGRSGAVDATEWSPARLYLVISGIFLVASTTIGFMVNSAFPATPEAVHDAGSGHIFGIFETNGWHNLSGMISGVIALGFAVKPRWARTGALLKGTMYVAVTISIAIWGPDTFKIASNTADQFVHGTLAVTGLWAGFATHRAT